MRAPLVVWTLLLVPDLLLVQGEGHKESLSIEKRLERAAGLAHTGKMVAQIEYNLS